MVELKYRVWNIQTESYEDTEDVVGISPEGKYICFIEPDDPYAIFTETVNGKYIIEQYTGLKDKNGKEIYEGDIITVMGYGTYIVFWREWDSSFSLKPIDTVKEEDRIIMLCEDWESDYKVIGNIHENKELLK